MVNATEMAKAYNKRIDDFTRLSSTQDFISALVSHLNREDNHAHLRDYVVEDVINSSKKRGTYMHRILALKFAAWLEPNFDIWIFSMIEKILYGHYKEHWEAHARQEAAKQRMEVLKQKMITDPTSDMVIEYFELEREMNAARTEKTRAIRNQLNLFEKPEKP